MTTIDPNQRLAAAIQQQVRSLRERARPQGAPASPQASRGATPRLSTATVHRLGRIDPTDPDRHRKAVRLYLEGEFAREFGTGVLNDPVFPQMVDAVQQQIECDAQASRAARALGNWLLARKVGA